MSARNNKKVRVLQLLICFLIAGTWEVLGHVSATAFFLVGTPSAVISELKQLVFAENLHNHFVVTGSEAVTGLIIGTGLGSAVGLSLWYSEIAAITARPFVLGLGTLPVFAFAPLMIVWFGIGFGMKVAFAAFSTLFVAFNQAYRGATSVSREYIDVLRGMNASSHQIFFKVIVPGSLNWVLNSMRINVGLSLLGAFIGEFIAADRGLGYLILRASGLYNIPRALAAAVGITLLALILDGAAQYVEKHRFALVQILSVPRTIWRK